MDFDVFQRARHEQDREHAPDAMHQWMFADLCQEDVPPVLMNATVAMIQSFGSTGDRTVGGFALPALVDARAARFIPYAYSVTDPIMSGLSPGSTVPLGTPENGGFSFSLTVDPSHPAITCYWLQRLGGIVFLPNAAGYSRHDFSGSPAGFRAAVRESLGLPVSLWFGEGQPSGTRSGAPIAFIPDQEGRARIAVVKDKNELNFVWLQRTDGSWSGNADFEV